MDKGYTLNEIDDMDFWYYLEILAYSANKAEAESVTTIDKIL